MGAIAKIQEEIVRQNEQWGDQKHHPFEWLSLIGEEYGELCRAVNETYMEWSTPEKGGREAVIREASHVGALICQLISSFEVAE